MAGAPWTGGALADGAARITAPLNEALEAMAVGPQGTSGRNPGSIPLAAQESHA